MRWNSKTKDKKHLRKLLIFTPIPLNAQGVWVSQSIFKEKIKSVQHSHTLFHILWQLSWKDFYENPLNKILYVSLLIYITDYLIGLAFWAIPIEL